MLQILRNKIIEPDESEIARLQAEFAATNCAFLPDFVDKSILKFLLGKLSATRFVPKLELDESAEFGKVLFVPETEPIIFLLHFLLNNQDLFRTIRQITGCPEIGNFHGRIHKSVAGEKHSIEWHGDNADHRLIGLTLNFSREKYVGGKFQVREKDSENILREIGDISTGDTFIFRIAPQIQHRLTNLESGGDRTVGVGWFRSEPSRDDFAKEYFRVG